MKQTIYLKTGWNLVSFLFKIDINELYSNKNILEIKSLNESYNKIIPKEFNTLKEIDLSQGYYIKSKVEQSFTVEGSYIDKVEYSLNEGWNLIGYPFDFEFLLEELDTNILEIKSIDRSYNSKIPEFSTLKSLSSDLGYWVKCSDSTKLEILNNNLEENYDIVIIGGGPAGSMVGRILSEEVKDKKILLLEKGSYKIKENYEKNYRNILSWTGAMNDPLNSHSFLSNDEKTIWLGRGLGGGTLHFGMQYVDQKNLYNHIPKIENYLEKVSEITETERFDYQVNQKDLWNDIYNLFKNDEEIDLYNNKIYSNDLKNKKRFIASDLLNDKNITIKTNANVEEIIFENENAKSLKLKNNKIINLETLILAGGAIENVKLLNNSKSEIISKLPIGKTIYDHAGVNFYFSTTSNFYNFISVGHLQIRPKDLKWQIYLSKVPGVPYLVVTVAQAKKEDNIGSVKFDNDKPDIDITYFTEKDKINSLLEGYNYIKNKLSKIGYNNIDPTVIDEEYIKKSFDSIYHYHGTCPFGTVVDESQKILGINNLYISDISVLNGSVPGSTSVASMTIGYRFAKIFSNKNILEIEKEINRLKEENNKLEIKSSDLFCIDDLRKLWVNEQKMYVVIQNDGNRIGTGEKKVYAMGDYWNGGGHPVNLVRYLEERNYDFTSLLANRHGSFSVWRIKKGGAIEVGLLDDGNNNQKIIDNKVRIQQLLEMLYAELVYDKKPEEKKNFLNINYLPFTKISTWNNSLKLVAMEDVSDIFLEKIEKILDEIFINKENKIVETFRSKNFIQRIGKKDMDYYNPPLVNRNGWDKTNDNNEAVDFIWEVDESDLQINVVFEHLLHTIYLALTFTDSSIWSFENDNSLVNKAMGEAISKGIYNINNYKFIKDEDINAYKRIIVQEYVFWLIYTMWGFNRIFKSDSSPEWIFQFSNQVESLLPLSIQLYDNHIKNIISVPKLNTVNNLFL